MASIKKIILALGFLIPAFCSAQVASSVPKTLTLRDAVYLALRYNPNIQSSELDRVVQKFDLRVAENAFELQYALTGNTNNEAVTSNGVLSHSQSYGLNPSVSLTTDTGTNFNLAMSNNSAGNYYNPGMSFTVTQPLIRGANPDVVLAPLRNAYDQELANKIVLRNGIISTIVTVINSYRSVISAELSLAIDQQSLLRSKQNYAYTQKFVQAGQKPRMDLAQAKLNITQSEISILNDEHTLLTSKQALLLNLGLNPQMPVNIPTTITMPNYKIPALKPSINLALANDPTYQQDLLTLRQDQRNLLVAKDNNKWQLNATAQTTWGNGTGGPPFNNFPGIINGLNKSQTFSLQLDAPINDVSNQAAIVSAQIVFKQQQIATDFQKDTVITDVVNGIHTLKTDQLSLQGAIEAEALQELNLQNAYKQFRAGQLDSFSVTQQEDALTQAQQTVLTSKITYLNDVTNFGQLLQQTLRIWNIKIRY